MVQIGRKLPGIAGLFVAGIFAAGLATMSSVLNTLAGTIYTDFVKDCLRKQTEKEASNKMKLIALLVGILSTTLVFLMEKLGSVFQVSMSISGIFVGSILAIFILGMTSRSANTKVSVFAIANEFRENKALIQSSLFTGCNCGCRSFVFVIDDNDGWSSTESHSQRSHITYSNRSMSKRSHVILINELIEFFLPSSIKFIKRETVH